MINNVEIKTHPHSFKHIIRYKFNIYLYTSFYYSMYGNI